MRDAFRSFGPRAPFLSRGTSLVLPGISALEVPLQGTPGATIVPKGFSNIPATGLVRDAPVVFGISFFGLIVSTGGLIAEFGGASTGSYCGFLPTGEFIVICGGSTVFTGQAVWRPATALAITGTCRINVAIDEPDAPGEWRIRVWKDGVLVPASSAPHGPNAFYDGRTRSGSPSALWAGGENGSFMADFSGNGYATPEFGPAVLGTVLPPSDYGALSDLHHYPNVTIP